MLADWTIPGASLASIGAVLGPALPGRGSWKDTAADTIALAKAVGWRWLTGLLRWYSSKQSWFPSGNRYGVRAAPEQGQDWTLGESSLHVLMDSAVRRSMPAAKILSTWM